MNKRKELYVMDIDSIAIGGKKVKHMYHTSAVCLSSEFCVVDKVTKLHPAGQDICRCVSSEKRGVRNSDVPSSSA